MQRISIEGFQKEQLVVAETPKMKSEQSKTLSAKRFYTPQKVWVLPFPCG